MPHNRTQVLLQADTHRLDSRLIAMEHLCSLSECVDRTIRGDSTQVLPLLPKSSIDLLIADPPYNLSKTYDGSVFTK